MSVLIATPCYGGNMTLGYFRSVLRILDSAEVPVDILATDGESLVSRARNNLAATFLRTDYKHLAFIDADIEIEAADFNRLAKMDGVRGAAVAMKTRDFSESLSCFADGRQQTRARLGLEARTVDFLGSAVLFIPREAFERLRALELAAPYTDLVVGEAWEFFPTGVHDGVLESEDYGFCRLCKKAGIDITVDPAIRVRHYGAAAWSH